MDKKTIYWLLGGLIVGLGVVLVIWAVEYRQTEEVVFEEDPRPEHLIDPFRPDDPEALETVEGGTRRIITEEIATPEPGEEPISSDIAVPQTVVQVGSLQRRVFNISGEGGEFVPSILVVNEEDIITLNLTSVDGDYDIFFPDFGVVLSASQGETERAQFQTSGFGEYDFRCLELCNAEGLLIVNPR